MRGGRKTIAIILGIVLVVSMTAGWIIWRRTLNNTGAPASNPDAVSSTQSGNTASPSPSAPVTSDSAAARKMVETAVRFEHASREWGVDPDKATGDSLAQTDTQTLLNQIRTPDSIDRGELDKVSALKIDHGPGEGSRYCNNPSYQAMCGSVYPTQYSYWRDQAWTMGSRLEGDPQVKVTGDNEVTVTGRVRIVLWSDTIGAAATTGWWAYTPATGTFDYEDTLTFNREGKVSSRSTDSKVPWIGDPWFADWSSNPCDATAGWPERRQPSIPVKGDLPATLLNHDPTLNILRNDTTMSGGLWDNVTVELPDTSCPECSAG